MYCPKSSQTSFVAKAVSPRGEGARHEWDSLHKLAKLPPETEIWPGHDFGINPTSTIGNEIKTNPFLTQDSFEDFIHLKTNWIQYKKDHNIP